MIPVGLLAALTLSLPGLLAAVGAVLLIQLQLLLDCCDGEVARWRAPSRPRASYLDALAHYSTEAALPAALGIRADGGWDSIGGWTALGLTVSVLVLYCSSPRRTSSRSCARRPGCPLRAEGRNPPPGRPARRLRLREGVRLVPFLRPFKPSRRRSSPSPRPSSTWRWTTSRAAEPSCSRSSPPPRRGRRPPPGDPRLRYRLSLGSRRRGQRLTCSDEHDRRAEGRGRVRLRGPRLRAAQGRPAAARQPTSRSSGGGASSRSSSRARTSGASTTTRRSASSGSSSTRCFSGSSTSRSSRSSDAEAAAWPHWRTCFWPCSRSAS